MVNRLRDSKGRFLSSGLRLASGKNGSKKPSRPVGARLKQLQFTSIAAYQAEQLLGEFNPRWVGIDTYRLMLCHPIVQFGLAIRRSAIINLRWSVESDDEEIKAFVTKVLEGIYRSLAVASSLAIPLGVAIIEKVSTVEDMVVDLEVDEKGKPKEVSFPNAWTIERIKNMRPEEFKFLVKNDKVSGVEQSNEAGKDATRVGLDRVIVWSYRKEDVYGDPRGMPLLKAAYTPWFEEITTSLFANRYFERKGEGIWKARAMPEVQGSEGETEDGMKIMRDAIAEMKNGGIISLPAILLEDGTTQGFDFELMQDDKRGDMFQSRIDAAQRNILRALLITDKAATSGDGTGSLAQAEVHERTMGGPLETDVQEFLDEVVNPQVVDPLVLNNFGHEKLRSTRTRVVTGGISGETMEVLREVLGKVMESEEIDPATGERVKLRDMLDIRGIAKRLGIPLKSAEEIAALMEEQAKAREEMQRRFEQGGGPPSEDEETDDRAKGVADGLIKKGALPSEGEEEE
jgi:hypothetical protein